MASALAVACADESAPDFSPIDSLPAFALAAACALENAFPPYASLRAEALAVLCAEDFPLLCAALTVAIAFASL